MKRYKLELRNHEITESARSRYIILVRNLNPVLPVQPH